MILFLKKKIFFQMHYKKKKNIFSVVLQKKNLFFQNKDQIRPENCLNLDIYFLILIKIIILLFKVYR
jgi:hypothetical protein